MIKNWIKLNLAKLIFCIASSKIDNPDPPPHRKKFAIMSHKNPWLPLESAYLHISAIDHTYGESTSKSKERCIARLAQTNQNIDMWYDCANTSEFRPW